MKAEKTELAGVPERVLALSLDALLFIAGCRLSFPLAFPGYPLDIRPAMLGWPYLWAALFVFYQAFFSCEGRVSLGKRLLGLRVLRDGEPLSLSQAAIRSALYPASSVLGLGFAWALFNKPRQCWHDLAVGSVVVRERAMSRGRRRSVNAAAALCLSVLAGSWAWENVYVPRYRSLMGVAYAQTGLREMAQLQKSYRRKNGRYATSLFALAEVSLEPRGFLTSMARLLEVESGVRFENTAEGFVIAARARDGRGTVVRIAGD